MVRRKLKKVLICY